jgi:hypothetical protein
MQNGWWGTNNPASLALMGQGWMDVKLTSQVSCTKRPTMLWTHHGYVMLHAYKHEVSIHTPVQNKPASKTICLAWTLRVHLRRCFPGICLPSSVGKAQPNETLVVSMERSHPPSQYMQKSGSLNFIIWPYFSTRMCFRTLCRPKTGSRRRQNGLKNSKKCN